MGRLIDADKFKEYIESGVELAFFQEPLKAKKVEKMADAIIADVDEQPTVEAIPKADYEARLKADMVAMLEEMKKEMNPIKECEHQIYGKEHWNFAGKCQDVIQQKINELKAESEG